MPSHAPGLLTLGAFMVEVNDARTKICVDSDSPWIEIDVWGRYGWRRFAIWKVTGDLFELDVHGAVGDDPIKLEDAIRQVQRVARG